MQKLCTYSDDHYERYVYRQNKWLLQLLYILCKGNFFFERKFYCFQCFFFWLHFFIVAIIIINVICIVGSLLFMNDAYLHVGTLSIGPGSLSFKIIIKGMPL
jgi:hypothetical protein